MAAEPLRLPQTEHLTKAQWRKSSQFWGLTREHAELALQDSEVYNA